MNTTQIQKLNIGDEFRLSPSSPVYIVMSVINEGNKIGYRHKVTDFPGKPHYFAMPDRLVYPITHK